MRAQGQCRLLLSCALLLLVGHAVGDARAGTDSSSQLEQQQQLKYTQATEIRSKPGVSARDLKQSVELLKFAAGLVPASDIKQQHHASTSAGNSQQQKGQQAGSTRAKQPLPVPGFPDLAFNVTGRADALRELALAYQRGQGVDVNHRLSLELFRRAAELGDAAAQGSMAMRMAVGLHYTGTFEGASIRQFGPPDEAGAILNYFFGASNGDMFASAALGYRHTFGLGVPKSCWSAAAYYKPVAEAVVQEAVEAAKAAGPLGSSSGRGLPQIERLRLNVHANQGMKPDRQREVLQYYQYSADRGNVEAQTAVGTLLNIGTHGVLRDHSTAAHYLQRAAAAGSAEAMAHLGHMYGSGLGVPLNLAEALRYFRKAADKNNPLGLYGLGYMYLSGTGVAQDYDMALKKLQAAADGGDRDAHFYLGSMYYNGLGMRRKSLSKAFIHFFQAAAAGHVQAQYNVAVMHLAGKGTQRACKPALANLKALVEKGPEAAALQAAHEAFFRGHHNQALLLYLQASELGIEVAQSNAAWMLQRGFGHSGPLAAAVATMMYRRSAEQGNVVSLLQLGDCYYYGSGVEQDWVRASAIYYEAYKLGSPEAMFNLGFMHEFGAGVPKDAALALRFYNMAKHTNADAALPVYLARVWLKLHETWEWLRPSLPRSVVRAFNWMFELRSAQPGAWGDVSAASGRGIISAADLAQLAGPAATGAAALPAAGSDASAADDSSSAARDGEGGSGSSSSSSSGSSWWLPQSPALLVWRWDAIMWKLTEAAGLAGLSINSFMQEYSDFGETVLLCVLLCVLLLVLHIRRQRQQALQARLMAALAAPDQAQQVMAQQIAAQLGLNLPPQQGPATTTTSASAAAGGGQQQQPSSQQQREGTAAAAAPPAPTEQVGAAPAAASTAAGVPAAAVAGTADALAGAAEATPAEPAAAGVVQAAAEQQQTVVDSQRSEERDHSATNGQPQGPAAES